MTIKVMTIVGTRPEIIKLSRVIYELNKQLHHVLVHSGQNYDYELNEIFFKEMGIRKPNYFLNAAGKTLAETIGNIIAKSDKIMEKERPDAILLYGDTNSCLSVIAAKRRKIPIFHMEAGNRCFDQRVPEELNRKIVDHLSDINMTLTEHARRYLIAEGIKPETIIKIGSPMKEILNFYMPFILKSPVLKQLKLEKEDYFVLSAHREENVDCEQNFKDLLDALNKVAREFKKKIIVSTHPRTRKKLESLNRRNFDLRISFLKPLSFFDYVKLQMNAACVISDSGSITEESSILNFPAVTIRQAHERPEGMDEGTLIMCGLEASGIINAIKTVSAQHSKVNRQFKVIPDYDVDNVSKKVVRIIMSYTDYVNRTVWYK
ncbi:MAG: UDP-N-acetylglucosamine 2-epimerase (non-hydrolyzing) [Candidatus Omnitrophica bacterium]|nr:UDP-N-acetylglucosamine 2-epimerase (non-hydrolyzing) [Candidatus Omnitrophota bacterium]